jgi:hypothetical protein
MVGDGDYIQMPASSDVIEYLLRVGQPVAGAGVHVNIGSSGQSAQIHVAPAPLS